MKKVPLVKFNNDFAMPQLGFGVWPLDGQTAGAVSAALDAGYRSFDTAAVHGTEGVIGRLLEESGIPREELFVTTKLWNAEQGYDATLRAFDASRSTLGLEYVDLYVIHWPLPARNTYVETWKAFERIYAEGHVKAIGVSNFEVPHLQRLLDETSVVPAVNIVELHPKLPQPDLRDFHARHGIATWAWNALGQLGKLLDDPVLRRLADKHVRSPAQVALRWHIQLGNLVAPKSVTPARIAENIDVFDFELDEADVAAIASLATGERMGPHPDEFDLMTFTDEDRAALGD